MRKKKINIIIEYDKREGRIMIGKIIIAKIYVVKEGLEIKTGK